MKKKASKEITVDEKGFVKGVDEERQLQRLFFPVEDAIAYVVAAMVEGAVQGRHPDINDLALKSVVVAVPMFAAMVKELELLEGMRLADTGAIKACKECQEETRKENEDNPLWRNCPGLLEKGDLIQNIVACAVRIGFQSILEAGVNRLEGMTGERRESSAVEVDKLFEKYGKTDLIH